MYLGLSLSFKINSCNGNDYLKIFNEYVNFEPDKILFKKRGSSWTEQPWSEKKHLRLISEFDEYSNFSISCKSNVFICDQTSSSRPHRSIRIIQDKLNLNLKYFDLRNFINKDGFVSGYLYNGLYEKVQSTEFANNLRGLNISAEILSTIKNTPYRIEYGTGFKIYDIRHNPGRKELIGHTWLMPAWKMWFGEAFYHLVPKDRILTFSDAIEIKEIENDIVYVHLFEKIEESWTKENMEKQWAWREWLNFDELTRKFS